MAVCHFHHSTSRPSSSLTLRSHMPHKPSRSGMLAPMYRAAKLRCTAQQADEITEATLHDSQGSSNLVCRTTSDGIMLCNRLNDRAKYMVRRLEDKEMDGEGGMVENWFLAGETAMAYCSVDHLGRLVCNLHEEGVYMVREIHEDNETHVNEHVVECKLNSEGKLSCKEVSL
eukprot:CAMPEP_0114245350 /NCGR_PEP_ID=MMETSP0058-20121206/11843_1 /TAXON_ID=36894 /ORGANISM="Pyramimonas parkeae, CCMP726" /LENGTH=171 /DNA_ID=CAMNT_0001358385 /DNA_START=355 /DNA_END=870 /DNA_ORIENTATION=+